MNARSGAEGAPKGPVRKRLARLIEPAVPRQPRRTGHHDEHSGTPAHGPSPQHAEGPHGGQPEAAHGALESMPGGVLESMHGMAVNSGAADGVPAGTHHAGPQDTTAVGTCLADAPRTDGTDAAGGSGRSGGSGGSGDAGGTGGSPGSGAGAGHSPEAHGAGPAGRQDPLEHPDPEAAADAAALENLLRCWVRETGLGPPLDGVLNVPLAATGSMLRVPVRHWSAVGQHRLDPPFLAGAPADAPPLEAVALAALIGREAAYEARRTRVPRQATAPRQAIAPPGHAPPMPDVPQSSGVPLSPAAAPQPTDVPPSSDMTRPSAVPRSPDVRPGNVRPQSSTPHPAPDSAPQAAGAAADRAPESAALVGRVADSLRHTAGFLAARRERPQPPEGTGPFLDGEQALLFGHPLHPTPKSREGLSEAEARVYSPELRGAFALHWMAVHRSVLAADSAWTERGRPVGAGELAARIAGPELAGRVPEGCVPLPLHPWQARELRHDGAVGELLDAGLLHDLGQAGAPWHPTSSVRTVFRAEAPAMLKLSLGLRITNSRRENLRKELLRGVEVHRLLRSGLGAAWRAAHPTFDIVRDPAWLGVDRPGAGRLPGFDTVVRHNPFGPEDDAVCLAGLTAPVPSDAAPGGALRSRLARLIGALRARTGRPLAAVTTEWFLRYLDAVVRPVLWLDAHAGVALEAHSQNTLVLLDEEGWPEGGRYRDNQGYYFRTSRRAGIEARLPGAGAASDSFVEDAVIDERFAYYLGINNVFGLIGALGSQGLADEHLLLAAFRRFLEGAARSAAGDPVSPLPALLLETPELRCKANLLTRLHGMDELVGPVDTQSVYVTLDNPLAQQPPTA